METRQLEKLNTLLALVQADTVSPKDIEQFLTIVLKVIKEAKNGLDTISTEKLQVIDEAVTHLETKQNKFLTKVEQDLKDKETALVGNFQADIGDVKETFAEQLTTFSKQIADVKKTLKELKTLGTELQSIELKDGKDADEEKIIESVLAKIPPFDEAVLDDAEEIKTKLESLEGDDRLDASAIKNLPENNGRANGGGWRNFGQLHDTHFVDLADNDIPVWNSTTQRWENDTVAGASGIERNTTSVSADTTLGATTKTDYVYFTTATLTLTLPTAVGNTNLYIIKVLAGTTTIVTTGGQTIDGSSSVTISVPNTSLSLTGNGTNWFVV